MTFALFIAVGFITCIVLGLARSAGRADDHAERCAEFRHADAGIWRDDPATDILAEVRSYSGDGWMTRHRRIADEVRGCDDIDRMLIDYETKGN